MLKELWLRVGVSINIDKDKIDDTDAITEAILSGVVNGNAYTPLEAKENEWLKKEHNYDLFAPIVENVIGNAMTEMLATELNKRGFKVIDNNKAGSGETYLVTIDHVDGPCTQLCDTEANAKAFVFGHITGYETFEKFDAALKGSIDAIEGLVNYSIVKQKAKDYIEVDNKYCADVCPCCGSSNIEAGRVEVDADGAHQPITCHNCYAEYDDNYRLAGYEITSEGKIPEEDSGDEYQCTKCDRCFTDEDVETFSPCICKVCAQNEDEFSIGWQVSDDDVAIALSQMNLPNGENEIQKVLEYLDRDEVKSEAMKADTTERQTELAQANIIEQINRNL